MPHMDPSASEEMALESPLGTIVYQSLPKPPERAAVCSSPVLTVWFRDSEQLTLFGAMYEKQ